MPAEVYVERGSQDYPLGRALVERYAGQGIPIIEVEAHHRIERLREVPDRMLPRLKRVLVIGVRKSLRILPNNRSADYIVPFTSSGCSASCLYCYLLCTFFSSSYLRVFVNREEIWAAVERKSSRLADPAVFEIGSNSDLVLEDSVTGSLQWAIERFAGLERGSATLATKFGAIDGLLSLNHRGKTTIRVSVNPEEIIRRIEMGTSPLGARITAANALAAAGYPVALNLAPVIMLTGWREMYGRLLQRLEAELSAGVKRRLFFEIIFMTYGLANEQINREAFPNAENLLDRRCMRPKGRGKYCYSPRIRTEAEEFLVNEIGSLFPGAPVRYIV
ncbi:MAG: spore photoproduct lyase [Firmicutes bacterium]|nr:spore photoproduct lyase [Bacillota bacterium]